MKYQEISWVIIIGLIYLLFLAFISSGCTSVPPPITTPGTKLLTKIIVQNNWLLTISILGIGAGFFAFLNGNSKGISIMASCFVVMSVILMVAKFAIWLGVITLVGAIALMVYTVLIRNRALKEVVRGVQNYKNTTDSISLRGSLMEQTKQTKTLIQKIKKGL
ncbi:hypothetical protein LCGC14_1922300 [marine sediment metagenome]|uniref:Uncharacterized protein n=1 Tax=marine sediment metagenome TaxID=412755 RepID=A0A0F9IN48_9ZZZZ